MGATNIYNEFINEFEKTIQYKKYDNAIFVCIGTDRITGDCFGPIVGSILMNKQNNYKIPNIEIIGSLEDNLSFEKVEEKLMPLMQKYNNPIVVSIDAALSDKNNIGKIYVGKSGIEIGKGLYKKSKTIGDVSIKAVVGKNMKSTNENFRILQNISLNNVMKLSNLVANGIIEVMYKKI